MKDNSKEIKEYFRGHEWVVCSKYRAISNGYLYVILDGEYWRISRTHYIKDAFGPFFRTMYYAAKIADKITEKEKAGEMQKM